jgi:hypothetical protein
MICASGGYTYPWFVGPLVAVQWEMELCWVPLHHSYGFTTTRKAGDVTSYRSVCARILDLVDEELHSSSS